jgi:hypothetical protein
VVPVRLPEATEALAWGIADVIGHDITAVCVIEPETVIALIVHAPEGAVQTAVHHAIQTEEDLIRWLSTVFTRADWQPQALVVVGSGGDIDQLMPRLEDVLSVPVFAPAEADLALARGAALASAHTNEPLSGIDGDYAAERPARRPRRLTQSGAMALLMAGAVTFVASVSAAISLEFSPRRDIAPADARPAAKVSAELAAATPAPPAAVPPAPVEQVPPVLPPPEAPVDVAPPPADVPVEPPLNAGQTPEASPITGSVPAAPVEAVPPDSPVAALPPESQAPGLVPAVPTPVPERRGILQRIRDRINGAEVPPPAAVPPPDPALVPPPVAPPQ